MMRKMAASGFYAIVIAEPNWIKALTLNAYWPNLVAMLGLSAGSLLAGGVWVNSDLVASLAPGLKGLNNWVKGIAGHAGVFLQSSSRSTSCGGSR